MGVMCSDRMDKGVKRFTPDWLARTWGVGEEGQ